MTKRTTIASALGGLVLATTAGSAWACSAVGPSKHVGVLLGVDASDRTFTVLDAETNRPITFVADEDVLARLTEVNGRVLVDFEAEGTRLRATDVRY